MKSLCFFFSLVCLAFAASAQSLTCADAQIRLEKAQDAFREAELNLNFSFEACDSVPAPRSCRRAFREASESAVAKLRQAGLERNKACGTSK